MNDFASGVTSMARNCLSACELVKDGEWTIERMEKWLNACIENNELAGSMEFKALHEAKSEAKKAMK